MANKRQERFAQSRPVAVHFTEEQIERANAVDIVDYARSMGLELKRDGKEDYKVKNYSGGFIITPKKNNWNWFDGNQGGGVVQLCMFLENKTWQEAVSTLINEDMEPIRRSLDWKPKEEPPKEFNLPPKNYTNKHVYVYLTKTRGIDADIVKDMLDKGYIYENQQRSCVFVGRDNEGVPRHASVRSTNTTGKMYKKDVSGSQKKFSFSVSGTSGNLNVFEAPIDALSYMSLQKMQGKPVNDSYVALGGVTDKALERFLEDHKDIRQITVCTDGDEAGENAAERISEKYGADYEIIRERSRHKDFNEDLVAIVQDENFRTALHEVVTGKRKISDSVLIGTTPNILVACGAAEGLDFTISKTVIDKCMRPEIRNADGKLTGKTGHGLTEEQLYLSLMNVKEPVMVLKGNRENSLIIITEYPDDKNRPIVVSVVLDKKSGRTMINNVSSVYGRDKFEEYIERQIQKNNILAIDNKKAEPLLQPIGKWYPKRGEVISYDATIAYSMESVKYSENISLDEEKNRNEKLDANAPYNENRDEQIDRIMEKLNDFSKLPDNNYEIFSDEEFQEKLYHTLQDYKKQLQDKPEGIITLLPKFYEQSNPNELDVKPDLWNEFWNYLERYGVTGDEKFSNRLNNIAVQPETKEQAFSIMMDIKEYLDNRLYMTSYMRGDVAVNEDIASYYMEKAYSYLNAEVNMDIKDSERNQDMMNQIKVIQKVFGLDDATSRRFYTTNLGGSGWGKGEKPYFYVTEDLQSSFDAAYASYLASDADGRTIGYSNAGMSASHLVLLTGCYYDEGKEVHVLNKHLENQIFDEDSKVLADIEKKLYEEFGTKPVQQEKVQVAIESTIDFEDREAGFTRFATENMPSGTKYRLVTYGEDGLLVPYQDASAIYNEREKAETYIDEHTDEVEVVNYDDMVKLAGAKHAEHVLTQKRLIEEGMHDFRFDDKGYLHFSIRVNGGSHDGLYRIYDPENGKNRELVSIDNGVNEPFLKENWERIREYLKHYVNRHPAIGENGEVIPRETACIYCEWSEHDAFEDGKMYSVSDFNERMKQADTKWQELRRQEREQYGENAFEELRKLNLPQHQTYEKVKYTVYVPGLEELTLRQDVGDGFKGVIDYIQTTQYKHYVEPLKDAVLRELNQELDDVAQVLESRTRVEDQAWQLQSEMRYEEANALLDTLEQNEKIAVEQSDVKDSQNNLETLQEDFINDTDQTFVLTGAKVSPQMQDILERLALGEEVSVDEINNTKEIRYCRSIADNGGETYLLDGREDKQKQVLQYMESVGSASGNLDENGKMIYDGDIRQEHRLDIVIGFIGAGKSSALTDIISQEFHSKVIDNDMAKAQFVEYQDGLGARLVHEEAQMICDQAFAKSLMRGENLVLPKVGSDVNKLLENTISKAKEYGYEVNVHFMDLEREKALGRVLSRLISEGRFLDPELIYRYCPDKEHNYCERSYEALKQNGLVSGYSRWDNDVAKGEKPFMVESHNLAGEYIDSARVKENEKGVVDNGRIGLRNNGDSGQRVSEDDGEYGRVGQSSNARVYENGKEDISGGSRSAEKGREIVRDQPEYPVRPELTEKSFAQQVDEVLAGRADRYSDIKVCDTPDILIKVGCDQLPIFYTQRHLRDAIKPKGDRGEAIHHHGLEISQIKKLPELLSDPVMIYDTLSQTRGDSLVIVTSEVDGNNNPIVVVIRPNGTAHYDMEIVESNFLLSAHGRNNFENQMDKAVKQDKVLYCNKQKSQELFSVLGLQLSQGFNNLDFDKIIHQSNNIVKEKKAETIREQENAAFTMQKNKTDDIKSEPVQQDMVSQYKDFAKRHKEMIKASEEEIAADAKKRIPIVINAYGGPGAGKSVSCMDICQQLKKLGYNAEYVQEYAKELVYDENWKLLDGSPENQFEVLKEQLKRVDRLYNSGEVDFIVTDSPILLNGVYNKSLTPEYDSMVTSLYNDFNNFTYFVERDASVFQQEGRIHNLEESQKIDHDIKQLLEDKKIYYRTYNHDTVHKAVSDSVSMFNRLNHIEEAATKKQTAYAEKIAKTLNVKLPEETTKAAYKAFINENQERFLENNVSLKEESADAKSYQDYLEMVTKNGSMLKDVPKEHYTDELLLAAVSNWGAAIREIPVERITTEIALASVQQYGLNLKHVPAEFRDEEICIAAYISSSGKSVRYTPKAIKDIVKAEGQKRLLENNNANPNSRRQIDTEQIQEQGQEWSARIENMLMEHESDPDAMIEDIAFASKFYQYSTRNIQLMRQQNRGITYVASASAFEKMGYHVKAGENAMIGRVPVFAKYITNEKKERVYSWEYTPEIKQKLKEGALKEQQTVRKFQFVAAFYDISQTDCPAEDYPSIFHMGVPSEYHQEAFDAMKEFAEKSMGFKVMITDLKSISLRGDCEPDKKIIRINDKLESTMALSTLCHEIAHGIIHTSENSAKMSTAQKECEADVMDIMLESSLGLSINGSRRDHFFSSFQKYREEEAAKERPYKVTLEKLIDRVQSKVFRTHIKDINHYLDIHLPAEGSQNEAVTKEVVKNLALLDSAYNTDHRSLIDEENELFDTGRIESYQELYQQAKEEYRLDNSFVPKLAVFKLLNDGKGLNGESDGDLWDLYDIQLLDETTAEMIQKYPEKITLGSLPHVNVNNILALKDNVLSAPRFYLVTKEEGLQDVTKELQKPFEVVENKINCGFDAITEYQCLHNLLENGMKLEPVHMKMYDHLCKVFDFSRSLKTDSSMRLMARINLTTEKLSWNNRELIAEYVFRTGNFEKAEKYADLIEKEPGIIRKLLQEMKLVDSYKYMLWEIEEYERSNDVSEKERITTGAYNTSAIPVLSENVSSLSQINDRFVLIRKHASSESIKYYAIVEKNEVFRIAYVELNEYQPETVYSTVTFGNYEEAEEFYNQYLKTSNSRLVDEVQDEELIALEHKENQVALSEITAIGKTIAAQKQQYKESGMSEEGALELLRSEIRKEHPENISEEVKETGSEVQILKDFKKMINYYGEEHFIELSNLNDFKDTDVSLRLGRWLAEQKNVLDDMDIAGIDDVRQCVDAALDSSVTAVDIEKAFNAIDFVVLSAEFSNIETEFEGFEEYNNVLDTLMAAHVTPDKFCYVDFNAAPGPYLYTSDLAGNIYRKSLSSEWDDSVQNLSARLKEEGYEICEDFDDFKAYAANNRLGIFNVPEKEKNEAYICILESTNDMLSKNQVLSVYDFKNTINKLSSGSIDFKDDITYKLVTRKDQEIHSYIDTYSGNSEQNVYEQLYGKAQEKEPELSKVISKQYYQDQLNFNEEHLIRPLLRQLKQENKSADDSEEFNTLMDSNDKLKEEIKKLDLSPADAELLKLNAGNIETEQIANIQRQQQMNQQAQQRNTRNRQQEGMSM